MKWSNKKTVQNANGSGKSRIVSSDGQGNITDNTVYWPKNTWPLTGGDPSKLIKGQVKNDQSADIASLPASCVPPVMPDDPGKESEVPVSTGLKGRFFSRGKK